MNVSLRHLCWLLIRRNAAGDKWRHVLRSLVEFVKYTFYPPSCVLLPWRRPFHPGTLNSSVALRSLSAGPRLLLNARSASLAPLEAAGGIFPGEPTARGRLTTTFSTNC